jgi:hypothetical protein
MVEGGSAATLSIGKKSPQLCCHISQFGGRRDFHAHWRGIKAFFQGASA